ncbi:MAG: hypothetical protein KF727_10340 [Microbacteriaceae bacterium]|nr:hypothetical protein [Microbacteriaceae bacterium]
MIDISNALLDEFAYHSNRLKLEYLLACCDHTFDPEVLTELEDHYHKPALIMGGMNEALRWYAGHSDFERTGYTPRGEPFTAELRPRSGRGLLFRDHDPRENPTLGELDRISAHLADEVSHLPVERAAEVIADFLTIKITAHDLLIHGRFDVPAPFLLDAPFALLHRQDEPAYMTEVLNAPWDAFRLENVMAYTLATGVDPAPFARSETPAIPRSREDWFSGVAELWTHLADIDLITLFRWDLYGMCAYPEGPVFALDVREGRPATRLERAWSEYDWAAPASASLASARIFDRVFDLIADMSTMLPDTSYKYFRVEANRDLHRAQANAALARLDSRTKRDVPSD